MFRQDNREAKKNQTNNHSTTLTAACFKSLNGTLNDDSRRCFKIQCFLFLSLDVELEGSAK